MPINILSFGGEADFNRDIFGTFYVIRVGSSVLLTRVNLQYFYCVLKSFQVNHNNS